jgi:hypothetical protein
LTAITTTTDLSFSVWIYRGSSSCIRNFKKRAGRVAQLNRHKDLVLSKREICVHILPCKRPGILGKEVKRHWRPYRASRGQVSMRDDESHEASDAFQR